jgi:DNA-binding transcriptional LysR family regulator
VAVENIGDIVVFVRVVEKQSFTAAARELNLSPSAVSRHISHLEESLGVQLIKRSTRRLVLTDIAIDFYEQCARIIRDLEKARGMASAHNVEIKGTLRVHATLGLGQRLVAPAVREFLTHYPDLNIDLMIGPHTVNVFEAGYDVVIRSAQLNDSSLTTRELSPVQYSICATPGYLAKFGTPAEPQDLKNFNCLIHAGQTRANEWRFEVNGETHSVIVRGNLRTNNGIALYEAVKGGLGIARLPGYAVSEDLRSGALVPLFQNVVGWGRSIKAFYPRTAHQPLRVRVFLDFIAGFMRQRSIAT